jgi:rare lipoprotein A
MNHEDWRCWGVTAVKHALFIVAVMWGLALPAVQRATPPADSPPAASAHSESSRGTVGLASWYGRQHQGKIMANGEPFDSRALTAASRTLPLGSRIHVVNLRNGKSVNVRVTDRGPNKRLRRRILDLSEAAAKRLGFEHQGLTTVAFVPVAEPNSRE